MFYIGITSNLLNRYFEHKNKTHPDSFTAKYNINKLLYYEQYGDAGSAVYREKQLKSWCRDKKIDLINTMNPKFKELIGDFM